ncbi:MAG: histidine kinase [Bacteroidales bacterium]|nr:histidine kinase [Bacteroidales bacterium]
MVEQKFFRAQMNPHFIFNALSSIQSFVLENDTETGSKYITRFARMMRKILDYSSKEFISLSDEIDLLKEYVAFQQLRFNHSFELVVDFDENIEKDLIGVPPMIIQPFVENAIEHGIREIDNGLISIRIMERNGQISVEILDNGIGYNQSQHQLYSQNHYSKAISITNERLRLFSKNNKHILPVKILDLSDFSSLSGTKVIIELPTKNI